MLSEANSNAFHHHPRPTSVLDPEDSRQYSMKDNMVGQLDHQARNKRLTLTVPRLLSVLFNLAEMLYVQYPPLLEVIAQLPFAPRETEPMLDPPKKRALSSRPKGTFSESQRPFERTTNHPPAGPNVMRAIFAFGTPFAIPELSMERKQ